MDVIFDFPFNLITGDLIGTLTNTSPILLGIFFFVFVVFAYKAVQIFVKAVIVGIIAASFPIVATFMGYNVGISLMNIVWFGVLGAGSYILYAVIMGGVRTTKAVTAPFRKSFKPKAGDQHHHYKTIVIKEDEEKKKG